MEKKLAGKDKDKKLATKQAKDKKIQEKLTRETLKRKVMLCPAPTVMACTAGCIHLCVRLVAYPSALCGTSVPWQ
jgi:hypothetical protein